MDSRLRRKRKKLNVSINVDVELWDIHAKDRSGKYVEDSNGKPLSVPYAYAQAKSYNQDLVYEEQPFLGDAAEFNIPALKARIEATLNQTRCNLILECPKQSACGCRVSVEYKVELNVVPANSPRRQDSDEHIRMYRRAYRANNLNWGCVSSTISVDDPIGFEDVKVENNVPAHECGHLFAFPDEYWEAGGSVHKTYIVKQELSFDRGGEMVFRPIWQIRSDVTLMGYGALHDAAAPGQSPTARVRPYYLEYVRAEFSRATAKPWKIGYE